jgi:lauroyl/myristoyl acyltransferase
VVRPLDNRYLNNFIVKVRTMYGHTILARRNGMRDMIDCPQTQRSGRHSHGSKTPNAVRGFLWIFLTSLPALCQCDRHFSLTVDVPVIPGFIVRTGFDTHNLYFGEEIGIERTGDAKKDIELNTARLNKVLEDFIRQLS